MIHYPSNYPENLPKLRYFNFPTNALAVSNIKAWEGAITVTSTGDENHIASNRFLFYQPINEHEVDVRYIYYYLISESGLAKLGSASPGSADRNRTLSAKKFGSLHIPLPDLAEQHRIAARLDHAVEQQTDIHRLAERAERYAAALLESVFNTDWPSARVDELLTLTRSSIDVQSEEPYHAIGVRSFGRGMIRYPAVPGAELSKLRYFTFPQGALVLSNIKAWEGAVTVSTDADSGHVASNRFLFYLPIDETEIDVRFQRYFLLSRHGLHQLNEASPGSADRNRTLSMKSFGRVLLPIPDIETQRRIANGLDDVFIRAASLKKRRAELEKALKPSLLNAAFSGQL